MSCVSLHLPPDEVVDEVFDSLLQLGFLQGDRVAFVGDLHDQFAQFVQLTFDLEEALCRQSKPERKITHYFFILITLKTTGCTSSSLVLPIDRQERQKAATSRQGSGL